MSNNTEKEKTMKKYIPSIEEVMTKYKAIAKVERLKCGRPCEATVWNTVKGARNVCRAARLNLGSPVSALTRKCIDEALMTFVARGVEHISAWTFVCQLRALFARWTLPYYRDAGWTIPPLELPSFRHAAPRYVRPGAETLSRVRTWYLNLDGELWFAATMMLEFAMRNGDVLRLKDENFVVRDGGSVFLSYTPHKTALTSGRTVYWPVHPDIWARFDDMGGFRGIDLTDEIFAEMNRSLRALGFQGAKASYELRKICIDHVYQKFGAEAATSISGDDIRTITRYYADPTQPNVANVRIIDLI